MFVTRNINTLYNLLVWQKLRHTFRECHNHSGFSIEKSGCVKYIILTGIKFDFIAMKMKLADNKNENHFTGRYLYAKVLPIRILY